MGAFLAKCDVMNAAHQNKETGRNAPGPDFPNCELDPTVTPPHPRGGPSINMLSIVIEGKEADFLKNEKKQKDIKFMISSSRSLKSLKLNFKKHIL